MPKTRRGSNSYPSGSGEEKYLDKARPLPHNPLKAARPWVGVLHTPGAFNRETICRGNASLPFQEWEDENFLHPFPPSSRTVNFGNEVVFMSLSAAPLTIRGTLVPFSPAPSDPQCRVALEQNDTCALFAILPRGAGIDLDDMVGSSLEIICTVQRPAPEEDEGAAFVHVRSYRDLDFDI